MAAYPTLEERAAATDERTRRRLAQRELARVQRRKDLDRRRYLAQRVVGVAVFDLPAYPRSDPQTPPLAAEERT